MIEGGASFSVDRSCKIEADHFGSGVIRQGVMVKATMAHPSVQDLLRIRYGHAAQGVKQHQWRKWLAPLLLRSTDEFTDGRKGSKLPGLATVSARQMNRRYLPDLCDTGNGERGP